MKGGVADGSFVLSNISVVGGEQFDLSVMDPYYLLLNPILTSLPEAGPYSSN